MAASQSIAVALDTAEHAAAFASVAIVIMFVEDLAVTVNGTVNVTLGVVALWWSVVTSLIAVVDSVVEGKLSQKDSRSNWVDADGSVVVGVISVASTTETESAFSVAGTVAERPLLMFWVVFDVELKLGQVKSDVGSLLSSRVSSFVADEAVFLEIKCIDTISSKNKIVGENVNVTVNVILDGERLNGFLEIHDNFEVHVASIVGKSVFASVRWKQVVGLTVISGNHVVSSSVTSASTLTANVAAATLTVGWVGWNEGSLLAVWTIWGSSSANLWVTLVNTLGQALTSLASIGDM